MAMQHGLLVDNLSDVRSEVDPACLTRKILNLAGGAWTHGQQGILEVSRLWQASARV